MERKLTDFIGSSHQENKTLTREELERVLKKAVDLIRTRVNYKEEHIRKIVDAFEKFEDVDGFARVVELDEIKINDYNLYVFPMEEEEIDVKAEWEELKRINEELTRVDEKIEGYLRELGYREKGY